MKTKKYSLIFFSQYFFDDLPKYLKDIFDSYSNLIMKDFNFTIKYESHIVDKAKFLEFTGKHYKEELNKECSYILIDLDKAPCAPTKGIDFFSLDKFITNYAFFSSSFFGQNNLNCSPFKDWFIFLLNIPFEREEKLNYNIGEYNSIGETYYKKDIYFNYNYISSISYNGEKHENQN